MKRRNLDCNFIAFLRVCAALNIGGVGVEEGAGLAQKAQKELQNEGNEARKGNKQRRMRWPRVVTFPLAHIRIANSFAIILHFWAKF